MRNSTLILALTLSVSCANVDREAVLKDVGLGPRVAPTAWQSREVIGAYVKLDIVGESHGGVV